MRETSDHLVPLAEFPAARERLAGRVARTPLLTSSTAAALGRRRRSGVRLGDDTLYLKAEHLQKTGSFKARGHDQPDRDAVAGGAGAGAITLSAGNAGQAYA